MILSRQNVKKNSKIIGYQTLAIADAYKLCKVLKTLFLVQPSNHTKSSNLSIINTKVKNSFYGSLSTKQAVNFHKSERKPPS